MAHSYAIISSCGWWVVSSVPSWKPHTVLRGELGQERAGASQRLQCVSPNTNKSCLRKALLQDYTDPFSIPNAGIRKDCWSFPITSCQVLWKQPRADPVVEVARSPTFWISCCVEALSLSASDFPELKKENIEWTSTFYSVLMKEPFPADTGTLCATCVSSPWPPGTGPALALLTALFLPWEKWG